MLTTPEFHTTNTIRKTGTLRALPKSPPPSGVTYKAIVYVLFGGGCVSALKVMSLVNAKYVSLIFFASSPCACESRIRTTCWCLTLALKQMTT